MSQSEPSHGSLFVLLAADVLIHGTGGNEATLEIKRLTKDREEETLTTGAKRSSRGSVWPSEPKRAMAH